MVNLKKKGTLIIILALVTILSITSSALMYFYKATTSASGYYIENTLEKWSSTPETSVTFQAINYSYTYPWWDVYHNSPQNYNASSQYNDTMIYRNGVYVTRKSGWGSNTYSILTRMVCNGSYYDIWDVDSYSSSSYPGGTLAVYNNM